MVGMLRLSVVLVVMMSGCYGSGVTDCGAIACPNDRVCDGHGGCALPQQLSSCAGVGDATACSYPGVATGECNQNLCVPIGCGNGEITSDEVCDDGNTVNGDGCSADCRSNETCGNGIVDLAKGEQCDGGDACRANCKTRLCGDGMIDAPLEACDDGDANSDTAPDACRKNCQLARCGDGSLDTDEMCDDGNTHSGDGCSGDCLSDETCGNGVIDTGELCDHGQANASAPDACRPDCSLPTCGDGIVDSLEGCDDGGANSDTVGGRCRTNCQDARCGDHVTDPGEVCDDGNRVSGDGCAADCLSAEVCGDGVVNAEKGETCDCGTGSVNGPVGCNGTHNSTDPVAPCRPDCTLRRCGDGILEAPEQCEPAGGGHAQNLGGATCTAAGFYGGSLACTPFCTFNTSACSGKCGDHIKNGSEQCDPPAFGGTTCADFNYYSGTLSCSSLCSFDTTTCSGRCGDGIKNGSEECDDQDLGGTTCQALGYYTGTAACSGGCTLITAGCSGRCGDGIKNGTELCDKNDFGTLTCESFGPHVGVGLKCGDCKVVDPNGCATCGDAKCDRDRGEDACNCPADCEMKVGCCGDGVCDPGETPELCAIDCHK
jgi:cysteine-rich repeat protein